ncbi:putative thyroid hormone receptor binding [Lyophyllum shimeji]|uniref:Thyroid hormone receptor binding n=1 Tax=Lyophyllum shimeji TaxID=47721 RepID=A0A9P3Q3D7_LYOSH|nr:putative thyroid hormone receptor binding [Lyophyllum shimeji]
MSSRKPPPRVESTQPRETSPEPSSSGEETAGEERFVPPADAEEGSWANGGANVPVVVVGAADENDEWIDEEDDDDDLLELEYHPNYAVTQALQSLDRQTDATIVVMAAPSHSTKLYSATSRAVRRQSATDDLRRITERDAERIQPHRPAPGSTRSHKSSLIDRFLVGPSAASGSGSDGSSESREEDLKRALEAALGSLGALGGIYEQREARWHEEMRRVQEDRERVSCSSGRYWAIVILSRRVARR